MMIGREQRSHPTTQQENEQWQKEHGMTDSSLVRGANGSKLVIDLRLLMALIAALAGGGVYSGYRVAAPVPEATDAHVRSDHDEITKLGEKFIALKEALVSVSDRLDKIEDKTEETNGIVKRILYGGHRATSEPAAPAVR
jgi:hypothetical protein